MLTSVTGLDNGPREVPVNYEVFFTSGITKENRNQSINRSFICSEQYKKEVNAQLQCRTGHKGMKHLQVPETKPNNKNTKESSKNIDNAMVRRPMVT